MSFDAEHMRLALIGICEAVEIGVHPAGDAAARLRNIKLALQEYTPLPAPDLTDEAALLSKIWALESENMAMRRVMARVVKENSDLKRHIRSLTYQGAPSQTGGASADATTDEPQGTKQR